jgi:hypothetical protein
MRWGHVASKGALRFASLLLWCHALSRAGPARALLCEQCGALLLPALLTTLVRRPSRCVVACGILLAALVLLQEGHVETPPGALGNTAAAAKTGDVFAAHAGNATAAAADKGAWSSGDFGGYPTALAAVMNSGHGAGGRWAALEAMAAGGGPEGLVHLGRAVQVEPINPALKEPGTKRLKLNYDEPLSNFAFKINLRRHIWASAPPPCRSSPGCCPPW